MPTNNVKITITGIAGGRPTLFVQAADRYGRSRYAYSAPVSPDDVKELVKEALNGAQAHFTAHRQAMIDEEKAMSGKYPVG